MDEQTIMYSWRKWRHVIHVHIQPVSATIRRITRVIIQLGRWSYSPTVIATRPVSFKILAPVHPPLQCFSWDWERHATSITPKKKKVCFQVTFALRLLSDEDRCLNPHWLTWQYSRAAGMGRGACGEVGGKKSKDQISTVLTSLPFRPKLISIGRTPGFWASTARSHHSGPYGLIQ